MSRVMRVFIAAVTLIIAVAIGIADVSIGFLPEITIFALIPIIAGTYYLGFRYGLFVAVIAATSELIFHLILEADIRHAELIAITVSHTFIYILTAALIDRLAKQLRIITSLEEQRNVDLDTAKRVHGAVFSPVPEGHGDLSIGTRMAFANELGGDYYHIAGLGEGLFFCIADISGKSTAAALFTALLNQSVTGALEHYSDLTAFVEKVNAQMSEALPDDMFVTMFCALINSDSLTYVNAGHTLPLLYSSEDGGIKIVRSSGAFPIGIVPDLKIPSATEPFGPGDVLLATTDGITESPAYRDRPYEKLQEALIKHAAATAQDIAGAIFAGALSGHENAPLDDAIVACVKRQTSS